MLEKLKILWLQEEGTEDGDLLSNRIFKDVVTIINKLLC